ncbi:MAG: undecaprenyl-diphosphate phosphatase, partial [Cycloclasticus sp.]
RFSFLLSVPLIFLAGSLKTLELVEMGQAVDWTAIVAGVVISALSAFACISLFLKLLERVGMFPFVIYRLGLGLVLLYLYWV